MQTGKPPPAHFSTPVQRDDRAAAAATAGNPLRSADSIRDDYAVGKAPEGREALAWGRAERNPRKANAIKTKPRRGEIDPAMSVSAISPLRGL